MSLIEEVSQAVRLPRPAQARLIRLSAGVSQERLAREVGVHRVTLARWESGECVPRGETRGRYSSLLSDLQRAIAA